MSCEASEGWEARIRTKMSIAAASGVGLGAVLATRHNTPLARTAATSTASVLILMGCFAAVQETVRRARCRDGPLNSALGGAATGALLFAAHGAAPPRGAVICGALGAAAHWAADGLALERGFRSLLVAWDLLDESSVPKPAAPPAPPPSAAPGGGAAGEAGKPSMWQRLRPYFPVRKLSEEEWEAHQRKQAEAEALARRAALAGVHPDALPPAGRPDEQSTG